METEDYKDTIVEEGSPEDWEGDWFRQLIEDHSEFYDEYPVDF